ncbi:DUF3152 domain-containing protein [Streptomyces sp. NPDC048297]|uniref:DUF3152 domain-containing protein n=1 Tax=Streptomyces sp. NPDC048297 TaxID=3365531 RepID=UPI0037141F88
MGRHSRRGPAPKDENAGIGATGAAARQGAVAGAASPAPGDTRGPGMPGQRQAPMGAGPGGAAPGGAAQRPGQAVPAAQGMAAAQGMEGTPAHGVPRLPDGTPARGVPRLPDGTPAHGMARLADGTPARGVPRLPDGTPAHGTARLPDGTPARGVPRLPDGTPARGVPRVPDGARGGHPEQREGGGGWGEFAGRGAGGAGAVAGVRQGPGGSGAATALPRQRKGGPGGSGAGPRQDYLDAFDEDADVFAPRRGTGAVGPVGSVDTEEPLGGGAEPAAPGAGDDGGGEGDGGDGHDASGIRVPAQRGGGKGRAFTGIAAAAVTTVLAVVVAGHVAHDRVGDDTRSQSATDDQAHGALTHGQPTPSAAPSVVPLTYEQKMDTKYPLGATLHASGKFAAVPGFDKAPGAGRKYTYRVDVEQGLGLDGALFAEAVQKTLNDPRSWAHGGARTFERVDSARPDFVITLASPGTTAEWCAKSGLDTTQDNVSCDSASTERVMINAYRWAQGSKTYGDKIHAYRQMLINHEVGHRLGHGHVSCQRDGELAPVMQQQTKFLDHDGIHCLPNPWPYPTS